MCVFCLLSYCLSFQRLSKIYGDCFVPLMKPHLEELAVDSLVQFHGVSEGVGVKGNVCGYEVESVGE